jgi:hypothetical protein
MAKSIRFAIYQTISNLYRYEFETDEEYQSFMNMSIEDKKEFTNGLLLDPCSQMDLNEDTDGPYSIVIEDDETKEEIEIC